MSAEPPATQVVALVTDLMDRSRIGAGTDGPVRFVGGAPAVAEALREAPGALVVVDLGRPDALDAVAAARHAGCRTLAYGAHVDRERLDVAHAAGAEVLARSAFFSRLADLLG